MGRAPKPSVRRRADAGVQPEECREREEAEPWWRRRGDGGGRTLPGTWEMEPLGRRNRPTKKEEGPGPKLRANPGVLGASP